MADLTPMYLMPGTHVTVREKRTPNPNPWTTFTPAVDRFTTPGKSTRPRAFAMELPVLTEWCMADIRKALGGPRKRKWETKPPETPGWPKPSPDPQPVHTPMGTWIPTGQLVSRAEAKRRGGGLPLNENTPAIGPVAAVDLIAIQDQRVNPTSCHTSGEYNQNSYEAPGKDCI